MFRFIPVVLTLSVVIGTSIVHGFWTDRWTVSEKVGRAAESLDRIPLEVGDWTGEALKPRGRDDQDLPGRFYARYTNRKTGDIVSVALVCGRPGPAAIHTPDVCYGAGGFKVGKRIEYEIKNGDGPKAVFYTADMSKTTASEESKQRIFWTWRADGRWQVSENPRTAFPNQPVLFKFYVARDLAAAGPVEKTDPCVEFMRLLLPELEKVIDDGTV